MGDLTIKLVDGSHNPPSKQASGLPMLSAINITDNRINFSSYRLISVSDFEKEQQRTRIQPYDILLTIVGAIGRTAVVPQGVESFTLQRSVAVLTPILIDSKFLMYQLESPKIAKFFNRNARDTAQKGVYLKTLGSAEICFPPLTEQHRIVAKIEALFSELDKGNESLKTAREQLKVYRQAVLKHAFEGKLTAQWREETRGQLESADHLLQKIQVDRHSLLTDRAGKDDKEAKRFLNKIKKNSPQHPNDTLPALARWVTLLDVCNIIVDCHNKTAPYEKSGIRLIRTPCIKHGRIHLNHESRFVSEETYNYWSRRCPPEAGDIIFTREAPMGEAGIVPKGVKLCMGQRMMLIRPPKGIDNTYLLYSLMEPKFHSRMTKNSVGTGVKHLRVGDVESLCIPLFALEEQTEIVSKLEAILSVLDEQESEIDASLRRSETLRQSILKKAFSGQLVPQDPNDEPASVLLERIKAEKAQQKPKTGKKQVKRKATAG